MTPLHLVVWHSFPTEYISTIEALLHDQVDTNAKDNEGMTPLSHVSQGLAIRICDHYCKFIHEKIKYKVKEACDKSKSKKSLLQEDLSRVMGLHKLKGRKCGMRN